MPVFPNRSSVIASIEQFFGFLISSNGSLMEWEVVHCRFFALPWCTSPFMRLLLLFSALCTLSERTICIFPTSWVQRIVVSTLRYCHLKSLFSPEGWFLLTSSWRQRLFGLLLSRIISPFPTVQLVWQEILRGRMAPSYWLRFPRVWSHRSPCIWKIYVAEW